MKKLVIFDLDGTLLDTIADLAASVNHSLSAHGFTVHDEGKYKFMVGNGISALIERALPPGNKTPADVARVRETFLSHYDSSNTVLSGPYPGIAELLRELGNSGIAMAVASNKYDAATQKLVKYYFPDIDFKAVIGNLEGLPPKPDPTVVSLILRETGYSREETVFVGDSGVDMQTASNAGVTAVGVTWGFRPRAELEEFSPAYIIGSPAELSRIIFKK